ncbi:N-acetylglucosamine-6-phosphate deacetylase [Thioclava sp. GXIMD4215]|uniref:N-acetylglucosamine-6-phosphate deacetylase n=1 Tax=Thioclava sp. GXIMD4215 TaxID=3131928 RepID=UPI00311AF84C
MIVIAKRGWVAGQFCGPLRLEVVQGRLVGFRAAEAGETGDLEVGFAGPALTDLQVNGAGGVMLNSRPDAEGIAHIIRTLRLRGTGWAMPTLITCEPERLTRAVDAAIEAFGMEGFVGLHIEGPHLNPAKRGTHQAQFIRPFDDRTMTDLQRLRARDIPVMLTLAPECVPLPVIQELARMGVVVSGGHSMADAAQTRAALAAGLRCFTHLYNAMPAMTSRAPNLLGAAIASEAYAGIILDGHHVDFTMAQIACQARPLPDRMFMVSDAMATIGGPDHFELYGQTIRLKDGALVNAEGALAGAHTDLVHCLRNAVTRMGMTVETAYRMAALVPRDAMGLARPDLAAGLPVAELLLLDDQLQHVTV